MCEALCSERAWQWRPKPGATRCAHCFFALYATFFCTVQNALRAYQICCCAPRAAITVAVATSHEQFRANAVRTARGTQHAYGYPTHAHHYAKQPTKA